MLLVERGQRVDRALARAGEVAEHVHDRLQVLVHDRLRLRHRARGHELRQRDGRTLRSRRAARGAARGRHGRRRSGAPAPAPARARRARRGAPRRGPHPGRPGPRRPGWPRSRAATPSRGPPRAPSSCAAPPGNRPRPRRPPCSANRSLHAAGEVLARGVARPVYLRHQRVEHGRTGRDLDHLHPRPPRPWRSPPGRGRMRLAMSWLCSRAVALADEVHLEVGPARALPQEVVAHEAVEVERRGRARVDLHVRHLGDGGQVAVHPARRLQRDLQGRAHVLVDEHLQLALVVEGQHLHAHGAQAHRGQGGHEDDEHAQEEGQPRARPLHERAHDLPVGAGGRALAYGAGGSRLRP